MLEIITTQSLVEIYCFLIRGAGVYGVQKDFAIFGWEIGYCSGKCPIPHVRAFYLFSSKKVHEKRKPVDPMASSAISVFVLCSNK